ncbi:peptidase family M28-domain-containing protein [Lipomyces japonicus]|uniref:peptidase family M28-domain-containing protein n=1 Tax=Lipomyces japonicus TaxID=56871 RepID=UPI0034CDBC89
MRIRLWISLVASCASACAAIQAQHTPLTENQLVKLYNDFPPFPALDPASASGNGDDKSFLRPLLIPRPPGSHNSTIVREFFTNHFKALPGWTVQEDRFTSPVPGPAELNFTNLIVQFSPNVTATRTKKQVRYLTLVAHYDSKFEPAGFIGATDSAVPCGILTYLAQALTPALTKRWQKQQQQQQQQQVNTNTTFSFIHSDEIGLQILFLDGEEAIAEWTPQDSLYGARHLAEAWDMDRMATPRGRTSKIQDIDLFVLLDLLGATAPSVPCYFGLTSWACKEMAAAEASARTAGVTKFGQQEEKQNDAPSFVRGNHLVENVFIDDDHMPFLRRGAPVLHVIPIPFPTQWHTMNDDADHLDPDAVHDWAVIVTTWVAGYLGLGEFV